HTNAVKHSGQLPTTDAVTVTDTLPAALTATAMSGTGWTCTLGTLTCSRSDALAAGEIWPPVVLTVNVASNAPFTVTNIANVSGGGEINTGNSSASDPTTIHSALNCGVFTPPVNFSVGANPRSVAVGDFNADGKGDLAVTNVASSNVSIRLGNGDGTFAAAVNYGAGTNPESVAIADFNGDGKGDLVIANNGSSNVSILLGNGNGTFAAAVNHGVGTGPISVAIGDFNGDGKGDLAVANGNNDSILLRNGNGTFAAAFSYAAGRGSFSVAIGASHA